MSKNPSWRISTKTIIPKKEKLKFIKDHKDLTDIPHKIPESVTFISLSNNPIYSLENLPTFEYLTTLYIDGTNISNFERANEQPMLEHISFLNTPLYNLKYHRLMAGLVYQKVKTINGVEISQNEVEFCGKFHSDLHIELLCGWTIMAINPVRMLHAKTRRRKTFYYKTRKEESKEEEFDRLSHTESKKSNKKSTLKEQDSTKDLEIMNIKPEYQTESASDTISDDPEKINSVNADEYKAPPKSIKHKLEQQEKSSNKQSKSSDSSELSSESPNSSENEGGKSKFEFSTSSDEEDNMKQARLKSKLSTNDDNNEKPKNSSNKSSKNIMSDSTDDENPVAPKSTTSKKSKKEKKFSNSEEEPPKSKKSDIWSSDDETVQKSSKKPIIDSSSSEKETPRKSPSVSSKKSNKKESSTDSDPPKKSSSSESKKIKKVDSYSESDNPKKSTKKDLDSDYSEEKPVKSPPKKQGKLDLDSDYSEEKDNKPIAKKKSASSSSSSYEANNKKADKNNKKSNAGWNDDSYSDENPPKATKGNVFDSSYSD